MRSNDPYRALWRRVAGPVPVSRADLDILANRISHNASLALRARARWRRAPLLVGIAAVVLAAIVVSAIAVSATMPSRQPATLLARTFEVAMVGPRVKPPMSGAGQAVARELDLTPAQQSKVDSITARQVMTHGSHLRAR
jgi:hypothetical protein